jgi:signal transduction histidine kinase
VTADGEVLDPASGVRLPPISSDLRIDYTAFNFASPQKTWFRYRLEGFDRNWIDAGVRRQAIYTNLPPGRYQFHVSASNDSTTWSEDSTSWDFSIGPRFHQTAWFSIVCGGAVIGCVWLAWRRHLIRMKRHLSLVFDERTRMAREIHDTLLQSLVGVALQFDVIGRKLESSPALAKDQLWRVRDEVEEYIREARQSIWDLRSPTLQTWDLASALRRACQSAAAANGARCEFGVSGEPRRYPVRVEEQLLRIAQEALTNAARHAHADFVRMNLCYASSSVLLRISDDGRGFDQDERPPGDFGGHWGLLDMKERAQQIGGRFTLTTRPGAGTVVETLVPYAARG